MTAASVIDRPVAEVVVLVVQITVGMMHSGVPIMGYLGAIKSIFPKGRSIDSEEQSVGIGHEVGHNMSAGSLLS